MLTTAEMLYNSYGSLLPMLLLVLLPEGAPSLPQPMRCNLQHCYEKRFPQLWSKMDSPIDLEQGFVAKYDVLAKLKCLVPYIYCMYALDQSLIMPMTARVITLLNLII